MTDLTSCGVQELDAQESASIDGGSDFSYAMGYTIGTMLKNPYNAIDTALQYYLK
jgi:hypothetical protein